MDVRIGVTYSSKELDLELDDDTAEPDRLREDVERALAGGDTMLWMTDRRGRTVGVPVDKVAYVEIGAKDDRRIGFSGGG